MDERGHVHELDRGGREHERLVAWRLALEARAAERGEVDERGPQALAAGGERLARRLGDGAGRPGGGLVEARLDGRQERAEVAGREWAQLLERAQRGTSPTCSATIPPASSR
jgi:hypothetical protein